MNEEKQTARDTLYSKITISVKAMDIIIYFIIAALILAFVFGIFIN